jgi:uncharacterized protein
MTRVKKLSKADVRRALVAYQFAQTDLAGAFHRLRSVQFDPLAPVGSNHDLVLQARVPGYRIGDWQELAYRDRLIYDGWDKQASLVLMESWPVRRIYHKWHRGYFDRIFREHRHAPKAVLAELQEKGPLLPREFQFQERKDEWKGSWFGPNLTKQTLRALWHSGQVLTHSRRGQHHVYDLAERLVPPELYGTRKIPDARAIETLLEWRFQAMGLIRPAPNWEVWSMPIKAAERNAAISRLRERRKLIPLDIEGQPALAAPAFLKALGQPVEPVVRFIAPLDQFMWDREMIAYLFGFEYLWEVYVPEPKRRWGYYVLPVLYGDRLVARMEAWARKGVLEIRVWHWEAGHPEGIEFREALAKAFKDFMAYSSTQRVVFAEGVDKGLAEIVEKPEP